MLNKDIKVLIYTVLFSLVLLLTNPTNLKAEIQYNKLYDISDIVGKYEHGGKGYQAVSKDSYGGYSYGKWQISTKRNNGKPSTFDFFLSYVETHNFIFAKILKKHGGYEAAYSGKKDFIKAWKAIANNPDFQKTYDNFIIDTQIIPVYYRMDSSNNKKLHKLSKWGLEDKSIEAAINSTIIQHGQGGGYKILYDVMSIYNPKTKKVFLKCLYEYRKKKFPKYKTRYVAEYKDLYNYLVSGNSKQTS